jgi:glycosyltransferase involved in cell wall biosynthesis
MRVAIVTYELLPQTGTSSRTLGFTRALVNRGHKVMVVGPVAKGGNEEALAKRLGSEYAGVLPIACRPGIARSMVCALNLNRTLKRIRKKFDFDVVHFANYNMNALAFPLLRKTLGVPLISDLHSFAFAWYVEPGFQSQPLVFWLANITYAELMLSFSDSVITPTEELKRLFTQRFRKPVFPVPNCVWFSEVSSSQNVRTREEKEGWIAIFYANFIMDRSIREVERLAKIVGLVRERGHELRLWVAGPGSGRVGNLGEMVRNLGYVDNPNNYLAQSDLVILPVRDLTLGLHSRLVEAMAAGKPVVASREACCGIFPYLEESGIVVCESIQQMVDSVSALLSDPDRMRALGERNFVLAKRLFSPETVGRALEEAYSETIHTYSLMEKGA